MKIEKTKLATALEVESVANMLRRILQHCLEAREYVVGTGCGIEGIIRVTKKVETAMKFLQETLGIDLLDFREKVEIPENEKPQHCPDRRNGGG